MFVPDKHFQPSLMFASKAGANLGEALFRCSTQGQAPDLTSKHLTRLEKLASDKHFSLLQTFVNYGREKFYNIEPNLTCLKLRYERRLELLVVCHCRGKCYKTFYGRNCGSTVMIYSVCHCHPGIISSGKPTHFTRL